MKAFLNLLLLSILGVLGMGLPSCEEKEREAKKEVSPEAPLVLIDFRVDSFLSYPLTVAPRAFFLIHPDEKNVVWIFNNLHGEKRLNLSTGDTLLPPSLREVLHYNSSNRSNIQADPFEKGVLWIHTSKLYKYDVLTQNLDPLDTPSFIHFDLTKDFLILDGRYLYDRHFVPYDTLFFLPNDIQRGPVFESEQLGLVINGYQYDTKKKTLQPVQQIKGVDLPNGFRRYQEKDGFIAFNIPPSSNDVVLIRPDGSLAFPKKISGGPNDLLEPPYYWVFAPHRIVKRNLLNGEVQAIPMQLPGGGLPVFRNDSSRVWIAGQYRLFSFEKESRAIFEYVGFPDSPLRDAAIDDEYLYLLLRNRFVIYRKSYLETLAKSFDNVWFADEKKRFDRAVDSLQLGTEYDLGNYLKKRAFLDTEFEAFLQADPSYGRWSWQSIRPNYYASKKFRKDILQAIRQDKLPEDILAVNLLNLVSQASAYGHFSDALFLDSLLCLRYPDQIEDIPWYNDAIEAVRKVIPSIDSLYRQYGETDDFLFQKGYALLTFIRSCGFMEQEVKYDVTLAIESWEELLQRFPESELADNAEYAILGWTQLLEGDDGFFPQSLDIRKAFLDKYPESDLKPGILETLLRVYAYEDYPIPNRKQEGLEILEQIQREFPGYLGDADIGRFMKKLNAF